MQDGIIPTPTRHPGGFGVRSVGLCRNPPLKVKTWKLLGHDALQQSKEMPLLFFQKSFYFCHIRQSTGELKLYDGKIGETEGCRHAAKGRNRTHIHQEMGHEPTSGSG